MIWNQQTNLLIMPLVSDLLLYNYLGEPFIVSLLLLIPHWTCLHKQKDLAPPTGPAAGGDLARQCGRPAGRRRLRRGGRHGARAGRAHAPTPSRTASSSARSAGSSGTRGQYQTASTRTVATAKPA